MRSLRLCLILAFAVACRRESTAPPAAAAQQRTTTVAVPQDMSKAKISTVIALDNTGAVGKVRVGNQVGSDGMVSADKTTFSRKEPILVSMWLNESPDGLQTSARIFDAKGKQVAEQRQPMNGGKTVTFKFANPNLKPGTYKLVPFWGGNRAGEFEIIVK